jgi:hypothetical protein
VNRTSLHNSATQTLRYLACGLLLSSLWGCEGQIIGPPPQPGTPPPTRALWLSYKFSPAGCSDAATNCPEMITQVDEDNYYCSIGLTGGSDPDGVDPVSCPTALSPTLNFDVWKAKNGFPPTGNPEARAIYGNLGDLRIGRDMNCVKSANGNIACYVTNYGPAPFVQNAENPAWAGANHEFPALTQAIEDAIAGHLPFATVAMVYNQSAAQSQGANAVTFYVFNGAGARLALPALDAEGGKTNPRMCMACHGGTYNPATNGVTGAQFLPFDVYFFQNSLQPGFTLDDQQEGYRKLNALVKETHPAPAIQDFIDGTYNNAVDTAGTLAIDTYVPQGWVGQEKLYNGVYRQYCRMCHLASRTPFLTFAQFKTFAGTIENKVCDSTDMPNAQVPYVRLWQDRIAQDDLRQFLTGEGITDLHSCK